MRSILLAIVLLPLAAAPRAMAAAPATLLLAPSGQAGSDVFGTCVARLGDVNGDGAADFAVGAPGYLSSRGRVYLYWGGGALDTVPDLVLTGLAQADNFGRSVAGAGDVNGDGWADVIVGARNNDGNGNDAGRAYVFYGGPAMDATADWVLTGLRANDLFGNVVDGAGDVDGDGFHDVLIGAHRSDGGATHTLDDRGRAYVYRGGSPPDVIPDWVLTGAASGDQFGFSVAGAGDVNGDGRADLIVGAFANGAGGLHAGRAYVYFGGAAPDTFPDLTFTGDSAGDSLGRAVGAAGDVNGDGWADVIAGAPADGAGGQSAGAAYVYFGGPGADGVPDLVLLGTAAGDQLGIAVGDAGDVDADGFDDVVVGANRHDDVADDRGIARVWRGAASPDADPDWFLQGEAASDELGIAVAGVGDLDGDGRAEFAAGAHQSDYSGFNAGRVYVAAAPRAVPGLPWWAMAGAFAGLLAAGAARLARPRSGGA